VCLTPCSGDRCCHRCGAQPQVADAVLAISYSLHAGGLHAVLRDYKRGASVVARRLRVVLSALLWRFLVTHEMCLAEAAGGGRFERVGIVPSGREADRPRHPLACVVGAIDAVAGRFDPSLLRPSDHPSQARRFDPQRFRCSLRLDGESVLLVDDTWTTGASAQSAAAALKLAGARAVGVLVIGRHIHAEYAANGIWLAGLSPRFRWERCALCRLGTGAAGS
jgi:hypothetical protein